MTEYIQNASTLEELCRLCLEGPGCMDIFKTYLLPQYIYTCTGVQVNISDGMPKTVCRSCYDIISKAYHLRLTAAANDKHLQALIKNTTYLEKRLQTQQTQDEDFLPKETSNIEEHPCIKKEKLHQNETPSTLNSEHSERSSSLLKIKVRKDLFQCSSNKASEGVPKKEQEEPQKDVSNPDFKYKCYLCCKSFLTRRKLYLHNRIHNKTHSCPIHHCQKKFATKGDLDKHVRTHTGIKPYVCSICEKAFTQGVTLKVHLESVHGLCKIEICPEIIISTCGDAVS